MKQVFSLNPYLLKYKWYYLAGIFFVCSSNFLSIFAIKYITQTLNSLEEKFRGNNSEEIVSQLVINAALFIGLSILSGVLSFYQRQTIIVSSRKIEFDLRNSIFSHYTKLPLSFYKKNKIGDLLNRISEDVGNARMYLGPGIMYLINLTSTLLIVASFMFYYDWLLALVALLPLPILSFMIYKVTSTIYKKSLKVQQNQSQVSSFVQDSFSGIRVIKSYAKEHFIGSKYDELTEKYKNSNLSLALTHSLFFPAVTFIIGLNYILIVYTGGVRYMEGVISFGTIVAFFMYVNILVWPFISLGWIVSLIQKAEASMGRINEFLEAETEEKVSIPFDENWKSGTIEFKNVSFTYQNTGIQALKNVSFKLEKNQALAIFGKTGSGKSTIALLLTGLLQPDEGAIFINNKNIKELNLNQLRESIGYIPQDAFLFSDTLTHNIGFGIKNPTADLIEKYAQKADVHSSIEGFSQKYETVVGERGVTLSGGQKQRISMARALIKEAQILIFDDALSAVDTETEETILQNIENDIDGKTTIIISHRISSAKNADYILVLEDGRVIEEGNTEDLMKLEKEFYGLYQKQISEKELHS